MKYFGLFSNKINKDKNGRERMILIRAESELQARAKCLNEDYVNYTKEELKFLSEGDCEEAVIGGPIMMI